MDSGLSASIHTFMIHLIDYPGRFPPATLPLEQAPGEYWRFADRWMLGRLIAFGSCRFDEPRADLRAIRLLAQEEP